MREHFARGARGVRQRSGQEIIRDRCEAILVGRWSDQFATQRLGRDVHQCSHKESCARQTLVRGRVCGGRDSEVEQLDATRLGVVHQIFGLQVSMHDSRRMRCRHGVRNLPNDLDDLVDRQRGASLGVLVQDLPGGPLDREVVDARPGLADLDGAHYVGVGDPRAKLGLSKEPSDCGLVLAKTLAQHLNSHRAVGRVRGAIDGRRASLPHKRLKLVSCQLTSQKRLARHGAILTLEPNPFKRDHRRAAGVADRMDARRPSALARWVRPVGWVLLAAPLACGGVQLGTRARETPHPETAAPTPPASRPPVDATAFYHAAGLLLQSTPIAFVGSVAFLPSGDSDSVNVIVGLAMSPSALRFRREGDGWRADYRVSLTLRQGEGPAVRIDAAEPVRVSTPRETQRLDEGVVFQQILKAVPGRYRLAVSVRDDVSGLAASDEIPVVVPATIGSGLSAPIPVFDAVPRRTRDSLPRLLLNPHSAAVFGRDSTISFYVEVAPSARAPLHVAATTDGQVTWTAAASMRIPDTVAGVVLRVPVTPLGLGMTTLVVTTGGADTTRAPVFVGVSEGIPTTAFADMLDYLRFFASAAKLNALAATPPTQRAIAWTNFYRETDSVPSTPVNEAMEDYFVRLRAANERFRDEGVPGWRTDRGMALLIAGEPDQVLDPFTADAAQRGRSLVWEYRTLNLNLEFVRQGVSQWRLTQSSATQLRALARRRSIG